MSETLEFRLHGLMQKMRREGVSDIVISRVLDIPYETISRAIGPRGKIPKLLSEARVERDAIMRRLRAFGVRDSVIASAFGLSRAAVHAILGPRSDKAEDFDSLAVSLLPEAWVRDFPAGLRAFRERHQLTQARLAAVLGLETFKTISAWENDRRHPDTPIPIIGYLTGLEKNN